MIIEITDNATPMISAIRQLSREVAFEVMSKVGNKVRDNAGKRMVRHRHNWHQDPIKEGQSWRQPYKSKTKTKELGQRTNKDGSVADPDSMRNMISSFLMEKSGTLIVGGRNKAFTPTLRKDGQIVGLGDRQSTITKHTQSIINKLDTGKRNKNHGWGKAGEDKDSMQGFENAKYKGRNFMIRGFMDSNSYMKSELTSSYEKTIGRAVNKVKVNLKPSRRTVS